MCFALGCLGNSGVSSVTSSFCPRDTKLWDHDVVVWKLLAGFVLFSLVCVHNGEHCSNFF